MPLVHRLDPHALAATFDPHAILHRLEVTGHPHVLHGDRTRRGMRISMAVADVHRLMGPDAIVGLSIKTPEQAAAAPVELLDYVGIGGVFATVSKDNPDPPIGVAGLARIGAVFRQRAPKLPLCAIAGIDASNAGSAVAAGADGVAVISALSLASNPQDAARELLAIVDAALAARTRT